MGVLFLHKKSVVLDLGDMNMASFNQEWGYVKYKKEKGSWEWLFFSLFSSI